MIEVTFLGTSGSLPARDRGQPAISLRYEADSLLFDCGEGTQRQLLLAGISPYDISGIFITHLDADHLLGLPGLLQTMGALGRGKKLQVFGPRGIRRYVDFFCTWDSFRPSYPVETSEIDEGIIFRSEKYEVSAFPVKHFNRDAFGFVFAEKEKINLDKEKLKAVGLLNSPLCRKLLEKGEVLAKGKKVLLGDVAVKTPGKRVVYTGDSIPCRAIEENSRNADLLIHDSAFAHELAKTAREHGHSTAKQAAETAKRAGAGQLALVHFSTRYKDVSPLEKEAREVFPNSFAAKDFMKVKV